MDGRITSATGAVPSKSTVPVMVPPAETGATLYGCVTGAITDGRGGTPSSGDPLRGCAEAVSSRAHDKVVARSIEKPSNRRGIYFRSEVRSLLPEGQAMCRTTRVVYALPSDPCGNYASAQNFGVWNSHNVLIEHGEVRVLPRRQRTEYRFLESGESRPDGHGLKSFFAGHLLLRVPAPRGPIGRILPGDCRVKREQRIYLFDREIGPVGDDHSGVEQRSPGIGAPNSLRSDAILGPAHVARLMRCL